jgi:hypothetical protein
MILEVHYKSASPDGLRKFIESSKCPIDEINPSLDFIRQAEDGTHILRYVTCCMEFHDTLKRKILKLHADAKIEETDI